MAADECGIDFSFMQTSVDTMVSASDPVVSQAMQLVARSQDVSSTLQYIGIALASALVLVLVMGAALEMKRRTESLRTGTELRYRGGFNSVTPTGRHS